MKKILFFNHPSLYSTIILQALLATPSVKVVAVINSSSMIKKDSPFFSDLSCLLKKTGIRYSLYLASVTVLYNLLSSLLLLPNIRRLCRKKNLPVLYTKNVNDEKTQEFINRQGFDLGVCAFFNQIFSEKSLNAQQKTILNLHPSLLPLNKGVDPTFYRRLRQEDSSGISLHKISPEIDAGHLISQSKVPIKPKQSLLMETYQHFKYGSTLLVETLNESTFKSITQSANSPTNYDSWPTATLAKKVKNLVSVTDFISILKELFANKKTH